MCYPFALCPFQISHCSCEGIEFLSKLLLELLVVLSIGIHVLLIVLDSINEILNLLVPSGVHLRLCVDGIAEVVQLAIHT